MKTESITEKSAHRLPGLDLLRAVAIVWVMLFHSYIIGGLGEHFSVLENSGWMGVDLFFVLSGYLIGSQLLKPLSRGQPLALADFYLRRAFRVLPAFFVVLALYFCWPAFREAPGIQPTWQFVTFTVNFLIDYQHNKAFSHVWSLCVEEHFYLVFPWLAWWLTRRPSLRKVVIVCIGLVAAGMLLRGYVWVHELAPLRDLDDGRFGQHFVEDIYYPTYMRLDGLLAGVVLATIKIYRPIWWQRAQQNANALLLFGIVVVATSIIVFQDRSGLLATVIGYPLLSFGLMLLVAAGADTQGWLGRIRMPGAGWLAMVSYSLYLTHKAVYKLIENTFGTSLQDQTLLAFAVYAAASLLVAALLHYAVERPFLRLRETLFARPRREQIAKTAVT
ncbi:acyltransferase [Pseudolysobacter antarcticus]|uniref:Acyltransferase n=1 Tax=Pseudolysobacter antarcticus TaxID=2511995 RepID=A0A411HLN8_9GAMM|nr:acyltransferase [Pseudolysobacter antarcticus]QBB71442.1 acyltransferase [Pseudolysobacter antarcticus]